MSDLSSRVERTLAIMHRWGYVPTLEALAADMLGGAIPTNVLVHEIIGSGWASMADGFVYISGDDGLLAKSKLRADSNQRLNGSAMAIAREFTRDLVGICPFVDCVALSGSVASGGYGPGDDIDFDLFVQSGTRYLCYLLAIFVGLKYAWRYRLRGVDGVRRSPLLRKVICVNVVWSENQTRPFRRQDEDMAFELLRCRPLFGAQRFCRALEDNPWVQRYFPQAYRHTWNEEGNSERGPLGRLLEVVGRRPRVLKALEVTCRGVARVLYRFVQWSRRRDPEAVARMEFLRRVKWPYEVFQE